MSARMRLRRRRRRRRFRRRCGRETRGAIRSWQLSSRWTFRRESYPCGRFAGVVAGKHIGVLTGGGDVPGLNAAIQSVYRSAKERGWLRPGSSDANVTGILRGWRGAVHAARDPQTGAWSEVVPLTDERVRTVD